MTDALKPCPFCNDIASAIDDGDPPYPEYCVECYNCEARGPWCKTHAEAIAAWNRRAEPVSVQEAGVLSGGMIWESRGEIHLSFDTREQLDAAYDALEAMLAPVDPPRSLAADKKE